MSWKEKAERVIAEEYRAICASGIADQKDILRLINTSYPFGQRKYHPYKQWLAARREFIAKTWPVKSPKPVFGAGELFEEKEVKP